MPAVPTADSLHGPSAGPCGFRFVLWAVVLLVVAAGCGPRAERAATRTVTVFAAASLTDALEALADSFEAANPGFDVVLNVAATSVLARQIDAGARADVFFSANEEWMRFLERRGRIAGHVQPLLGNRLVVVAALGAASADPVETLRGAGRLALADPEHVPAGSYARRALECLELWQTVRPRTVPMLDVRAALLSVYQGAADAGIVYASDVRATDAGTVSQAVPERCQPEIRYVAAVPSAAADPTGAALLLEFAAAPARAVLWRSYGFVPTVVERMEEAP